MAAYTSSGSGKASAAGTWGGGGTPSSNGDTFTISSGHAVEWDLDTSGLANGLGASTINGTLYFCRTAGTYYLKMNGTLTVSTTGTLDASDGSGGAYPSNCTATILLNGNFSITVSGNGVVNLSCGEPTHKYVKLSQAESASATTLHVDTDVTAEALWASGALIRVDNINQAVQSEERTISGSPTATTITITAGLTASKLSGAYLILVSRNVKVLGASTASGTALSGGTNPVVGAEIRNIATGISGTSGGTLGGTISNITTALTGAGGATLNGAISSCSIAVSGGAGCIVASGAVISAAANGFNAGAGHILLGLMTGCGNGFNSGGGHLIAGSILNSTTALVLCGGLFLRGATLNNNTRDVNQCTSFQAINTLFGSSTEFLNYNIATRSIVDYAESLDHDQTAGAFRAWPKGGIVSSVSSPVFDAARPRSYQHVLESASAYSFMQRQVQVAAGGSLYVRCYVQKDASMSYLPRLWVFSAEKEPLISGSPDVAVAMTNSVNTWEVLEAAVTNTTDAPKLYTVRTLAKNASGNVYFDPIIRTSALLIPADMEGLLAA